MNGGNLKKFEGSKFGLAVIIVVFFAVIIIVSILRERIVNPDRNQVSITGQGRVTYQSDIALINLGLRIDNAMNAQNALMQLSDGITRILNGITDIGISRDNIITQNYVLTPRYTTSDNVTSITGYNASQQLLVIVPDLKDNNELIGKVVQQASDSGANQINSISYSISNLDQLKQRARVEAINDAREKSKELAEAAGVTMGKVITWYENVLVSPDISQPILYGGVGNDARSSNVQIPSGIQEIVIEIGLNFEVR